MGKKVTVEQVKKALQCKQYNASEQFTMDVTGLSHSTLGRIFMLQKADRKNGIAGIYTTGNAGERLRDVVAEAIGYTAADRDAVKHGVSPGDDSSAEPEQLTLDDAEERMRKRAGEAAAEAFRTSDAGMKFAEALKELNDGVEQMFEKLAAYTETVAKLLEKGRDE